MAAACADVMWPWCLQPNGHAHASSRWMRKWVMECVMELKSSHGVQVLGSAPLASRMSVSQLEDGVVAFSSRGDASVFADALHGERGGRAEVGGCAAQLIQPGSSGKAQGLGACRWPSMFSHGCVALQCQGSPGVPLMCCAAAPASCMHVTTRACPHACTTTKHAPRIFTWAWT